MLPKLYPHWMRESLVSIVARSWTGATWTGPIETAPGRCRPNVYRPDRRVRPVLRNISRCAGGASAATPAAVTCSAAGQWRCLR
jgi:hypothetical protein